MKLSKRKSIGSGIGGSIGGSIGGIGIGSGNSFSNINGVVSDG